jgi:glycine/D-amino acid oxidase-like deaminating enzyme
MADKSYDVVIIGAGFGGSSCAGLLAKRGLKVLLLDKNANAGGKAMSLSKNGYTYTAWVVIGAPVEDNLYQQMLDELEVADLATLAIPGAQGSFYKSPDGTYSRMPEAETDHLDPEIIFNWLGIPEEHQERTLEFFTNMAMMEPEDVAELEGRTFDDWLSSAELPRSLYAFIVSLCCDGMFMVPVDKLDAAEAITCLQGVFIRGGGVFCEGGFGKVAEAYCEAVRRYGSDVMMGTRVRRVIVEDGKVAGIETDKGRFKAPIVISNAGLQPTVLKLVGEEHFDPDYTKRVRELVPSYSLIGYRYFLSKPVTDAPFGVVFSDESPWTQERLDEAAAGEGSREGVQTDADDGMFLSAGPGPFERAAAGLGECRRRSAVWRIPRARGGDREQGLLHDAQRFQRYPGFGSVGGGRRNHRPRTDRRPVRCVEAVD